MLQTKKENYHKNHKRYLELSEAENEIEFNYNLIDFLERKNFNYVRKTVKEITIIIKNDLFQKFKAPVISASKKISNIK
jgi:hypothetical protein